MYKTFILSVFLMILTLTGCDGTQYNATCQVDPATGAITCGGGISGTFKAEAAPELPTRSYGKMVDRTVQARVITRDVSPCDEGRGLTRAMGAEVVDIRTVMDINSQTRKYDLKDLKERQSRENHNEKVLVDATPNRSMWSRFIGLFGFHRKLEPLPAPVAETVDIANTSVIPNSSPSQPLPNASNPASIGNDDGSFSIPATKAVPSIEARLLVLEASQRLDHNAILTLNLKADQILSKLK